MLSSRADELAEVLTQSSGDPLDTTLSYATRELFRNVVEHSGAASLWYCAQYWPSQDKVELGILDEGRGIKASLSDNPDLSPHTESDAIELAVAPGVSRINPRTHEPHGMWPGYGGDRHDNTGYGLYVVRELARHAGSLFLISHGEGILFRSNGRIGYSTTFRGTAVRLVLRPSRLGDLLHRILHIVGDGKAPSTLTPSLLAKVAAVPTA